MSDSKRAKVLIVDDLPEKLLVYRTMLDELDQELVLARSGLEALKLVLRHDFAVILLDVNMPGVDGFETASLIRRRKRSAHTPIIFITAYTDDLRIAEGYALGAVDCIMAPVAPAILRAKVMVFVSMHRLACQARRQAEERVALVEERSRRTAAEESNRRLEVLANAGRVIGSSLDFETTLLDLVRLAVLALADFGTSIGAWQLEFLPRSARCRVGRGHGSCLRRRRSAGFVGAYWARLRREHQGTRGIVRSLLVACRNAGGPQRDLGRPHA
jgi:CheY-like chemotaxis protein